MDGDSIRRRRQELLMTQQHLADAAGISVKTVKRFERGEGVSFETRRAVASVLGFVASGESDGEPVPAPEQPPVPDPRIHGGVLPLNEEARRRILVHAGPSGFVPTSPDASFMVTVRRFGRRRVRRHGFGRPMRPVRTARVVVGDEDAKRRDILAAAAAAEDARLPVYEIAPPARSPIGTAFLWTSRTIGVFAFMCLLPVAVMAGFGFLQAATSPIGNPWGFFPTSTVVERSLAETDLMKFYGLKPNDDRRGKAGPWGFPDRFDAYRKNIEATYGRTGK